MTSSLYDRRKYILGCNYCSADIDGTPFKTVGLKTYCCKACAIRGGVMSKPPSRFIETEPRPARGTYAKRGAFA